MSETRAVLLDALGTLVDLEPPGPRLRALLAERLGVQISQESAHAAMRAEIGYYRAQLHRGRDRASLARLRRDCALVLRGALPELAAVPVTTLTQILLDALSFRAFADAPPALTALRRLGLRLVVVTNWDCSVGEVLARTGLAPFFAGTVSSAVIGAAKPDIAVFRHALTVAGVPAGRAVHVGDSLEADVAGARAAGIEPVYIVRDGSAVPDGVRAISSLSELPALVR